VSLNHLHISVLHRILYILNSASISYSWYKKKEDEVSYLSHWQSHQVFSSPILISYNYHLNRSIMNACMWWADRITLLFFFFIYLFSMGDRYYCTERVRITKTHSIYVHAYCLMVPAGWHDHETIFFFSRIKASVYDEETIINDIV
jgi:hypothetical protein